MNINNTRELLAYLSLKHKGHFKRIYQFLDSLEKLDTEEMQLVVKNIHVPYMTMIDNDYPQLLKDIHYPPFCLFLVGDLKVFKKENNIKVEIKKMEDNSRIFAFFVNDRVRLLGYENGENAQGHNVLYSLWDTNTCSELYS